MGGENTGPPAAAPDACSLQEAQAVCAELVTGCWQAYVSLDRGRWSIRQVGSVDAVDDFTAPIARNTLREYLFRTRRWDPTAVLELAAATAIVHEHEFSASNRDDGY